MKHLASWPRFVARAVVGLVLLLVGVELAMQLAMTVRTRHFSKSDQYLAIIGDEGRQKIYPGWSEKQLRRMLAETYVPVIYEPFTGFAERPRHGKFVNVADHGYRLGGQSLPWPPSPNTVSVFVFGGSTTFGYGVTDSETIPAALRDSLPSACGRSVQVYNFGRGFYYSTQERALFNRLVTAGHRPAAAVFIDGLNDADNFDDTPPFAEDFARLFHIRQGDDGLLAPFTTLTATGRVLRRALGGSREHDASAPPLQTSGTLAAQRWLENVKLVTASARGLGIAPLFVLQPVPGFRFDFSTHPLADRVLQDSSLIATRAFYGKLESQRSDPAFLDILWLADAHQGRVSTRAYVDPGHYTAEFSAYLGGQVARMLAPRLVSSCSQEHT